MSSTNYQPQQSELRERLNKFLAELPISIEDLPDNYTRISVFIYFLTIREGEGVALKSAILNLFDLADIGRPSNIDRDLGKMQKDTAILPAYEGYRLHRKSLEKLKDQLETRQQNIVLKKNLVELSQKIKDPIEKDFLEEAIRCFGTRPASKRATILLSWIAAVHHLQSFVWRKKNHLKSFNKVLPINSPKNSIKSITKIEDFSELNEELFILKLKEAKVIDKNIHKQLVVQLGVRNTCGHPNSVSISDSKVEAFVDDVIQNVLLRYKK